MKKFLVETYYTCTFKTVHTLDELNDKELSKIDQRKDGEVEVIEVKLNNRKTKKLGDKKSASEKKLTEKGYVLEKHLFERWICDEAASEGAAIHLGHKLNSMEKIYKEGKFSGWRCDGKGDNFPIEAKIVIDASGVAGICSRLLSLNPRPKVIAGMQYEMLEVPTDDYLDFYIWPKYAEKGYVWMIPKCDGRANVGLVTEDKSRTKKGLDEFIANTHFKDLEQVAPPWKIKGNPAFGGTIPISGPHENTYADGLMLVGDAAGFTSPLFEGGSHLALWSGREAASVVAKAISNGDLSKQALMPYEAAWKKRFPPYHKILKGKTALYELTDEEMSVMAQCLPDELSNMSPLTVMSNTLGCNPLVIV